MANPELDLPTLVQHVALGNVRFFELSARLVDTDVPESQDDADEEAESIDSTQFLQTDRRDDDGGFRIRVKAVVDVPGGQVIADAGVEYEIHDYKASDISASVMLDFANDIAVMQLIPFLRHAIADLSQQVFGAPLLLPMLQRGDMHFEAASGTEATDS
jgi:hypothetical protein